MAKMRLGFTPEVRRRLMQEAHAHCRREIPVEPHVTESGRKRIARERRKYLNCIGEYIRKKILEEYQKRGIPVAGL